MSSAQSGGSSRVRRTSRRRSNSSKSPRANSPTSSPTATKKSNSSTSSTQETSNSSSSSSPYLSSSSPSPSFTPQLIAGVYSNGSNPMGNSSTASGNGVRRRNANGERLVDLTEAENELQRLSDKLEEERNHTSFTRKPLATMSVFARYVADHVVDFTKYLLTHKLLLRILISACVVYISLRLFDGPQTLYIQAFDKFVEWFVLWLGLGFLSSFGFGFGLHTFLLFLGPFIGKYTFVVTECGTLDVAIEGPNAWRCPQQIDSDAAAQVTTFNIWMNVFWTAFVFGTGTAVGELPPYFIARHAHLAHRHLAELDEIEHPHSWLDRIKKRMAEILHTHYGFLFVVACASIPNPLFDVAGVMCGYSGVPLFNFFFATFLGKAVIKINMQALFVVIACDKKTIAAALSMISHILPALHSPLAAFFDKVRTQYHPHLRNDSEQGPADSWISTLWNGFIIVAILLFVIATIDATVKAELIKEHQATLQAHAARNGINLDDWQDRKRRQVEANA